MSAVRAGTRPPPRGDFPPVSIKIKTVDPDRLMLAGVDTRARGWPVFGIGEVARLFFNRTDYWLRWRESHGKLGTVRPAPPGGFVAILAPDGTEIGHRGANGFRRYCLSDVERMTHGLAASRAISGEHAAWVLPMVAARAHIARLAAGADEQAAPSPRDAEVVPPRRRRPRALVSRAAAGSR